MRIGKQLDIVEKIIGRQFYVVMCAATLVANGVLELEDSMQKANHYWKIEYEESCENCPCVNRCIVCKIEES